MKSKLKNINLGLVLSGVAVFCLGGFAWLYLSKNASQNKNLDIHLYQEKVVDSYKQKSVLIAEVLKAAKVKDQNIEGILLHISGWKASQLQDVNQIEELNSYLDQHYSGHVAELKLKAEKSANLKEKLVQLLKLEEKINSERAKIIARR